MQGSLSLATNPASVHHVCFLPPPRCPLRRSSPRGSTRTTCSWTKTSTSADGAPPRPRGGGPEARTPALPCPLLAPAPEPFFRIPLARVVLTMNHVAEIIYIGVPFFLHLRILPSIGPPNPTGPPSLSGDGFDRGDCAPCFLFPGHHGRGRGPNITLFEEHLLRYLPGARPSAVPPLPRVEPSPQMCNPPQI